MQLQQLIVLGCHFGQGYLFSCPLDQRAVTALLRQDEKFFAFPPALDYSSSNSEP